MFFAQKIMAESRVAVATTTFYKDTEEGRLRKDLSLDFFRRNLEQDYPVFVVDGGTDDGKFIADLNKMGIHAYPENQRGLGGSRREAMTHAYSYARQEGVDYLAWSEPEKTDFVSSLAYLMVRMNNTKADLIVPQRKSMENYPTAQQHSETFGNQLHTDQGYVDASGKPLDTFFGPKVWKRQATPYFLVFDDKKIAQVLSDMRLEELKKYGIGLTDELRAVELQKAEKDLMRTDHAQHMPVCLMVLRGRRVVSAEIDYTHPAAQTKFEEENQSIFNQKRLLQTRALNEQFALVHRLHQEGTLDERLEELLKE